MVGNAALVEHFAVMIENKDTTDLEAGAKVGRKLVKFIPSTHSELRQNRGGGGGGGDDDSENKGWKEDDEGEEGEGAPAPGAACGRWPA